MQSILNLALKKGAEYAQLSIICFKNNILELNNKDIDIFSSLETQTTALRLIYNNSYGLSFTTNPEITKQIGEKLVQEAIKNAKLNENKLPNNLQYFREKKKKKIITIKPKIKPGSINIEDKKEYLLGLIKPIKKIVSLNLSYKDETKNFRFYNSEGFYKELSTTSTSFMCQAFAKDKNVENYFKCIREIAGFELMKKSHELVRECQDKAIKLLNAKFPKSTVANVIIDQNLGGVFTHEAVGHACEADSIINKTSLFKDKLNKRIGNENVSIIDDGSLCNWGYTPFDNEGSPAQRTILIKDGILSSYLHTLETAALMKLKPTGNARSENPSEKIIPRMTNTYFLPDMSSNIKFKEMLKHLKNGYYLKGSRGGVVDSSSGQFIFNAKEAYEVKNGEIKQMLKGVSLSGNILKTLHNILLIGNDLEFDAGMCGKNGQYVPVGDGSPHLLIKNVTIGTQSKG